MLWPAVYDPVMGSARVVASMALLLAVGPLLLLAPWWPLPDHVVVLLLFLTVVALLLLFFVVYRGSSARQADWTATAGPHRPRASWQAGRWDTDSRHAFVANVGEGIAYQVSVAAVARERVDYRRPGSGVPSRRSGTLRPHLTPISLGGPVPQPILDAREGTRSTCR